MLSRATRFACANSESASAAARPSERQVDALVRQRHPHAAARAWAEHRAEQAPEQRHEHEKLGPQYMALVHVDDPVAALRVEAEQHLLTATLRLQRRAAAAVRRRDMRREDIGRVQPLRRKGTGDPLAQVGPKRLVIDLLDLAAAAFGKVPARRLAAVRAGLHRIVGQHQVPWCGEWEEAAALRDAVAAGGEADDGFGYRHSVIAWRR
jgi:hypothetical protein